MSPIEMLLEVRSAQSPDRVARAGRAWTSVIRLNAPGFAGVLAPVNFTTSARAAIYAGVTPFLIGLRRLITVALRIIGGVDGGRNPRFGA
jgi:hypothetical protein